ncbi:MAG: protein-(glutamine-N5) methyltransferase, release factor-specific [Bacteroides sp. 43_108]|nr:MAG: protein-(glutamine-N5) methyltransferase, release factor-specific [Bacteroides sp. 43_108]
MEQIIQHIRKRLTPAYEAGEATAIAYLLMEKKYGLSKVDILTGKRPELTDEGQREFETMLDRLAGMEPIQYVLGIAEFDGFDLRVSPAVLIPRPETEELVEWIADDIKHSGNMCPSILDIGTGSGCIPIALARRFPEAGISACDISEAALKTAKENAERLKVEVDFFLADALDTESMAGRGKKYDIIVSNPPYVCEDEKKDMEKNVLEHEPHSALFVPDNDPLMFYRAIAVAGKSMLKEGGSIYFEINRRFPDEMTALMNSLGYSETEYRNDMFGNPRMVHAKL